ncbi:MAG: hypothetical protein AB8G11_08315 [Saprospiraceae bacterium]
MFTKDQLKKLPFNYRKTQGGKKEVKQNESTPKVQGFNYVAISKLHTEKHIVLNFNKPISKLFELNDDDSNQ